MKFETGAFENPYRKYSVLNGVYELLNRLEVNQVTKVQYAVEVNGKPLTLDGFRVALNKVTTAFGWSVVTRKSKAESGTVNVIRVA